MYVINQDNGNTQNQQPEKAKHFLKLSEIYEDQISFGSQSSLAVYTPQVCRPKSYQELSTMNKLK